MTLKGLSISALAMLMLWSGVAAQVDEEYEREILRALGELPQELGGEKSGDGIAPPTAPLPMQKPIRNDVESLGAGTSVGSDDLTAAIEAAAVERREVLRNAPWVYTEGVARAIRREYLTFQSAGRVAYVDPSLREGLSVEAGQRLAYQEQSRTTTEIASADARIIDARTQLSVARASEAEAAANLKLAARTFERFKKLIEQQSASQQEFDQAEAQLETARAGALKAARQIASVEAQIAVAQAQRAQAEIVKQDSELVSPISGIISRFNIEQGYYFNPQLVQTGSEQAALDTVPVVIIDTSRFEISLKIRSELFDELAVGGQALIDIVDEDATLEERLPDEVAGPNRTARAFPIEGTIYSISPSFDTETRTFNVKIRTTRGAERLRDGENVSLWIRKGEGSPQLVSYGQPIDGSTQGFVLGSSVTLSPRTPATGQIYDQPATVRETVDPIMSQPGLIYDQTPSVYSQPALSNQPGIIYQ